MTESAAAIPETLLYSDQHRKVFSEVFGNNYMGRFTDPVIFREFRFYSPPVTQEYNQNFKVLSRNLFAETVYRRRKGFDEEILNKYHRTAGDKLDAVHKLISLERDRLRELALGNGVTVDAGYLHSNVQTVPIIHSHALSFIKCLVLFDQLLQLSAACDLEGQLSPSERTKVERKCRRAIRSFSGTIRTESQKMRDEAVRLQKENASDEELNDMISAQEEGLLHADALEQAEALGITIPSGADPVQVIANAKAKSSGQQEVVNPAQTDTAPAGV